MLTLSDFVEITPIDTTQKNWTVEIRRHGSLTPVIKKSELIASMGPMAYKVASDICSELTEKGIQNRDEYYCVIKNRPNPNVAEFEKLSQEFHTDLKHRELNDETSDTSPVS